METYLSFIIFLAINPIVCVTMFFLEVQLKDKIFINTENQLGIICLSRYQTVVFMNMGLVFFVSSFK